jgi:hypothetical protein
MKYVVFFLGSLLITGCATFYHPIGNREGVKGKFIETASFKAEYRLKDFEENSRMNKKMAGNGYAMIEVFFKNKTDSSVQIDYEGLRLQIGDKLVSPVDYRELYQASKLRKWIYLLYSPYFIFEESCIDNDCNVFYFPLGLIIGLLNTAAAYSGNVSMESDLEKLAWKNTMIEPGKEYKGYAYYSLKNRKYSNLQIEYKINGNSNYLEIK